MTAALPDSYDGMFARRGGRCTQPGDPKKPLQNGELTLSPKQKEPVTPAVRALRAAGISFEGHPYTYVSGGGTAQFAREQGVDEHLVIKTLIMEDENGSPVVAADARGSGGRDRQSCPSPGGETDSALRS
jgi:hypothetical protein